MTPPPDIMFTRIAFRMTRPGLEAWVGCLVLSNIAWMVCALVWDDFGSVVNGWIDAVYPSVSRGLRVSMVSALAVLFLAGVIRWVQWIVWSIVPAASWRASVLAGQDVRRLEVGRTAIDSRGVDRSLALERARSSAAQWSLGTEEVSLCPLPRLGLGLPTLACEGLIAIVFFALWFWGRWNLSITTPYPVDGAVLFLLMGLSVGVSVVGWMPGSPLSVRGAAVGPGWLAKRGWIGERRAHARTDEMLIEWASQIGRRHRITVFPKVGPAWCLDVPGRAIDLVLGAWLARELAAEAATPRSASPT